ncbi:O-antigen ligase family protein [Rossellomorea sp. KS-H15a]|uniref:O-antigen ligase family protein n=1 Tax=Rossellomorea sp. KS-H15a TaxID=2963940 RepID=UPI0020C65098|nr:O-antigen ligase family protein [Rossellomorea sp. KS-H15a]UTE77336.1 O-antigen ligase family protein [Rossellomorea sp. KS-H15a]
MNGLLNSKRFLNLFLLFILIQPVIDILTTYSLVQLESNTTFGVLIRILYMFIGVFFILINVPRSKLAKNSFIYLLILGAFVVLNIGLNYFIKSPYYIGQEIKFFIKVVYVNIVFLNFILVLKLMKEKGMNHVSKSLKYVLISSLIISVTMIISLLTNTSLESYESAKIGYTGWFFAGNEIGAIIAIILPIICLYAIRKTKTLKDVYYWIPVILASLSLLMLGTKVGYGAILIVLLASSFVSAIVYWKTRSNKDSKSNLVISLALLVMFLLSTPFTPVFNNINVHLGFLGFDTNEQVDDGSQADDDSESKEEKKLNSKQMQNLILSSREEFLAHHTEDYMDSPMLQKIFGLGFAGNYDEPEPKMIEMDFFDLFFSFGIIGFIIFIAPIIFFLVKTAKIIFKNFSRFLEPSYVLLATSIILTLGIAYFAGHVFTAPSVSIYFALIFALFVVETGKPQKETNK